MQVVQHRFSSIVRRLLCKSSRYRIWRIADVLQAQQAISEEEITTNSQLCGTTNQNFLTQIRADFTNCALPPASLSGSCITGEENEPQNCGFSSNLQGLCSYCGASSPNATDSCCIGSNVTSRCQGIKLPLATSMPPLFPSSTSSASPSATNGTAGTDFGSSYSGLSGGQIAGIVIGSIFGALLLLGLLALCCVCVRRRRTRTPRGSIFNQPSPRRGDEPPMAYAPRDSVQQAPSRVARMAALEGNSSDEPNHRNPVIAAEMRRRYGDGSDSDPYGDSAESRRDPGRPLTSKRNGSLSSNSVFGGGMTDLNDETSPHSGSGGQFSSPEGIGSGQSEQLPSFKDYYSQDDIHPNDKVAALWTYQPRAGDEFELERGDMLKVVGIWDDGWATGVRIPDRAEDYEGKHKMQRDSGVSNGSGRREESPPPMGEIKAFPVSLLFLFCGLVADMPLLVGLCMSSRTLEKYHRRLAGRSRTRRILRTVTYTNVYPEALSHHGCHVPTHKDTLILQYSSTFLYHRIQKNSWSTVKDSGFQISEEHTATSLSHQILLMIQELSAAHHFWAFYTPGTVELSLPVSEHIL